jgi:hypothetical protein
MVLSRVAAHVRRTARAAFTALCFAVFGAALFVVGVFIHSLGTFPVDHWNALLPVTSLFAILGAIFGTIVAFDRTAQAPSLPWRFLRRFESPTLRTTICAALGALAVVVVRSLVEGAFPAAWLFVGGIAGAVLGWYGWRWAKFVDF